MIRNDRSANLKILDIGCGKYKVQDAVGIDINSNSDCDLLCDAHSLPISDKSIDAIHCHEVLEHLHSPVLALREFYRVLKDKGILYLSIPNINYWLYSAYWACNRKIRGNRDHIWGWGLRELDNLFYLCNFKIENFWFDTLNHGYKPSRLRFMFKPLTERNLFVEAKKNSLVD